MKICANPNCVHSRVPQPISNFGNCKRFSDGLKTRCHHINPVVNNPVESADVDNCITLCVECHKWSHQYIPGCKLGDLIKCSKNKTS